VCGPSLIQSNFGTPELGNLEVVVRESNSLAHYWRSDQPPFTWHGPLRFAERQVSGNPAFIQSGLGYRENFEVVAPRGGKSEDGLVHYCRNNDHADLPWIGPTVFATRLGHVDAVALIQSNFGIGNLELIVRVGDALLHLWREDSEWNGPIPVFQGADGVPGFIQSRHGCRGNLEVVTPLRTAGIARLWRNNDHSALPWVGPTVFGTDLGQIDAVALIQSNFGTPGIGNLEIAARIGNRTAHFWREDQDPPRWVGPTVFMCEMPAS
jgi:hypothetical protein